MEGPVRRAFLPAESEPVIFGVHADHCPVARTLSGCVEIVTRVELEGD